MCLSFKVIRMAPSDSKCAPKSWSYTLLVLVGLVLDAGCLGVDLDDCFVIPTVDKSHPGNHFDMRGRSVIRHAMLMPPLSSTAVHIAAIEGLNRFPCSATFAVCTNRTNRARPMPQILFSVNHTMLLESISGIAHKYPKENIRYKARFFLRGMRTLTVMGRGREIMRQSRKI